ncbi:MAG: hypothetical protein MK137_09335, partial [Rickettsiales bacterium]|nr:hypothetical protein [Rickettsiales bacterium]
MLPKTMLGLIYYFIRPYKWLLLLFFMLPPVVALCSVMMPFQIKTIVDLFLSSQSSNPTDISVFILPVAIYIALSEGINAAYRSMDLLVIKALIPLRARARNICYQYLIEHSYRYTQNHLSGELGNKILDVGNVIIKIMELIANPFLITLLTIFFSILLIGSIHMYSALILGLWCLFFISFSIISAIKARRLSYEFSSASSRYMGKLIDSATNIASIKLFSRQKYEYDALQEPQNEYITKNITMNRYVTKVRWILGVSTTLFQGVVLFILVKALQHQQISVGGIVFIMTMTFTIASALFEAASR